MSIVFSRVVLGFVCVLGAFFPLLTAQAETVVRFAETVSVNDTQEIQSDFYVLAGTAAMSGRVAGDMYVVGGTVTVNGPIEADFSALSGRTQLSATVTDDVRLVTGEAVLSGPVGGDVFVIGGSLQVLSTATIGGDIYMFGGSADIAGTVGGSVRGTYTDIRVDAVVAGDIDVQTSGALTLGAEADVAGNVRYTSPSALTRSPDAVVAGDIVAAVQSEDTAKTDIQSLIIPFLLLLFSVLVAYLLAKQQLSTMAIATFTQPVRALVIGCIAIITIPVTVGLLIISSLGLLLGLALLALYIASLVVGYIVAPIILGAWLAERFGRPDLTLLSVMLGTAVFYALMLIPLINVLAISLGIAFSFGALLRYLYRRLRV